MNNFKVIDFRFAKSNDEIDEKFKQEGAWSRIYEYKYVLDNINRNKLKDFSVPEIHNTSWGFEGVHVIFRDSLDKLGKCVHSDIVNSEHRNTYYYDITTENLEFKDKFDFVVNVSTIEHLESQEQRLLAINNLFKQVKNNGYLILTFDYPRVNLDEIEELAGQKCDTTLTPLNGKNSKNPNLMYEELNIIYLIIKKNKLWEQQMI